jgi:hypothetical protein
MLFEAIKPCVEIAKRSPGNPASFLIIILLARLKCPSCVGTQPILNEALDSPPILDVHHNLGLGDKIFDFWLLPAICLQKLAVSDVRFQDEEQALITVNHYVMRSSLQVAAANVASVSLPRYS